MNKKLATFKEGEDHVKISHFTQKGFDIKGVIHVGTHNGYEVEQYLKMGIDKILGFEPLNTAYEEFCDKYHNAIEGGEVKIYNLALGETNRFAFIQITDGDGQGSSFKVLEPCDKSKPYYHEIIGEQEAEIQSFNYFLESHPEINPSDYDCLVIDAQGMELEVLRGMAGYLASFKYLNIECSNIPIYIGEAPAYRISAYLETFGFIQDTPTEEHNDIMFIRKDLV